MIYEFKELIKKVHDIDVTYIEFPYDVKLEFGYTSYFRHY